MLNLLKGLLLTIFYVKYVATDAPFQLVTRAEWLARPPKEVEHVTLPLGVVFIHHSCFGEAATKARCCREVRNIQTFHIDGRGRDICLETLGAKINYYDK